MKPMTQMLLAAALLVMGSSAWAATILNNSDGSGWQIAHFSPIGQSFVAEDEHVFTSLYYFAMNPSEPIDSISLSLYKGLGSSGGALLGTDTFALSPGYEGWHDSDFAALSLVIGQTYSIAASVTGGSAYWGVRGGGDYAEGVLFTNFGIENSDDLALRITPQAAVPIPAAVWLFGSALAGLAGIGRCKPGINS